MDGLTDTQSQSPVPVIVTISIGVCATLLLLLSVTLITCLVHKRRQKTRTASSRSFSSDNSKPSVSGGDGFSGSQGTSCYNDTMSEETMSYISERSGSFIERQDSGLRGGAATAGGPTVVAHNIQMMVSRALPCPCI